jgi:hypothetical protein
MRYIVMFLVMAGMATAGSSLFGGGDSSASGISNAIAQRTNCRIVYPSDAQRLQAIYDAAVAQWSLTSGEWGVIYFMPGTYDMGSTRLQMTQSRTRLVGAGSSAFDVILKTSATEATGFDGLVEITAFLSGLENMTIITNDYSGSAVFIDNTRTGTATLSGTAGSRTITLTGIGVDVSVGDYVYAYAAADSGGAWAKVTSITSDNAIKTTGFGNGSYTVEVVSIVQSEYRNLILKNASATSIDETASGLHYKKDLGGRWYNIQLSNSSGMNRNGGEGWDIVGIFDGIYAPNATKIFGMDNGNYQFNGIARNFITGNQFIGCGTWSSDIGPQAIIEYGRCGDNSFAVGRKILNGAIFRDVRAGTYSFASANSNPITTANGAGNSAIITFTAAEVNDDRVYGPTRGRAGLTVYLTGTNVTDDYYVVSAIDTGTGAVTFTANPCTGATTDCQMTWGIGDLDTVIVDCYATDAESFASQGDTSPHRINTNGKVVRCFVGSTEINKP